MSSWQMINLTPPPHIAPPLSCCYLVEHEECSIDDTIGQLSTHKLYNREYCMYMYVRVRIIILHMYYVKSIHLHADETLKFMST